MFLYSLDNSEENIHVIEAYGFFFVMDMFSPRSDLDVSINFDKETYELSRDKKLEILQRFAEKLCSLEGLFNWFEFSYCC